MIAPGEIRWKHKNALGAWEDFGQAIALQADHPVASLNLEVSPTPQPVLQCPSLKPLSW